MTDKKGLLGKLFGGNNTQPGTQLALTAPSVSANAGAVAVGANNSAPIVNVQAAANAVVLVNVTPQLTRELPSYLARIVARLAEETLSAYNSGPLRELPPEVSVKLAYYNFPPQHVIITNYRRCLTILEACYRGIEQRNDDARRLVQVRTGLAYNDVLYELCAAQGIPNTQAQAFARSNAIVLVAAVVTRLLDILKKGAEVLVYEEVALLAVNLIVADAVIECNVLERPVNAATT